MLDGDLQYYDKCYLFCYGGEYLCYVVGNVCLSVDWKGWWINLQVCYDLCFLVFCCNCYNVECVNDLDFDLQIFVVNWFFVCVYLWCILLCVCVIENLCYVVVVNWVGIDGNDLYYVGDSVVIDCFGQLQVEICECEQVVIIIILVVVLVVYCVCFLVMLDVDSFDFYICV